ncbi:MAG TPA: ABC transporter permease [Acidimicrobiia bacterium]|jgi:lipooligosaccharide transport system permease protein|nr:ABC transporter permease [Acidimicrobiia bacterium]
MTAAMLTVVGWNRRPWRLVERHALAYRRMWYIFLSGFAEPIFFLLSIGVGVGELVGTLRIGDHVVDYRTFVAPGLLATTAMTGALLDTTFNFFAKMKYAHTYDAVLATPLGTHDVAVGEITWALLRATAYSGAFVLTMWAFGDLHSPWAVLCLPAAVLIAFAFAGAGLACTTFMRTFIDFDYVNMVMIPLFLFSATFFPIDRYPDWLEAIVRCTPLYQGVALERSLVVGDLNWTMPIHAVYLVAMGWIGLKVASKRIGKLLQP